MRTTTNKNSGDTSVKQKCLKRSYIVAIIAALSGSFFSTVSEAQSPVDACRSGCTSNDVQIIGAFLSDANGNQLTSYVCGSNVPVYLSLQLTTNTPRKGVSIYSDIQTVANNAPTGNSVGTVSQCFGNSLATSTNVVTFTNAISWTCGQQIALVNTYTAWGTGNTNFCGTSTTFKCGATPSKCNAAKAGEIIIIQIPTPGTAPSPEKCSETAGSPLAHFDLTTLETAIKNGQNVTLTWWLNYDGTNWTNQLTGTDITNHECSAASKVIHAKVCNASNATACADAAVTLTVFEKPGATFTITQPVASLCNATTSGALNFCTTSSDFTYKVGDGTAFDGNGSAMSVSGLAAGSNPAILVTNTNTGGISAGCPNTFSCSQAISACETSQARMTTNTYQATEQRIVIEEQTKVIASPNPFNDRIKFVVNSSVAGRGSLEVFNMLGQKVKTVYQGSILAGTQIFEMNLPAAQRSNIIYVLRVGEKRITGKLLHLNR